MASGEEDQTRVGGGERVDIAVRPGQTPLFLEHASREDHVLQRSYQDSSGCLGLKVEAGKCHKLLQ